MFVDGDECVRGKYFVSEERKAGVDGLLAPNGKKWKEKEITASC